MVLAVRDQGLTIWGFSYSALNGTGLGVEDANLSTQRVYRGRIIRAGVRYTGSLMSLTFLDRGLGLSAYGLRSSESWG